MVTNKSRIQHHLFVTLFCIAILILLLIEIILNLTPPIARDALIHHLAIPKLWLKNGGFYEIKWADFSYFPMNVDLLYIIPLYFNKDFLANFIHMSFGIGTALLIYQYLNNKISRIAGLLGILVFLSTPIVVRLSTQAYVDLGLAFFTTASILAFIRYRDGEFKEFKWLFLSSVAMGLALGTKYNALIVWFFLSLAIVFVYSRDTKKQWKAIKCG
jgi:4-amino-4-deoxy-L-arabinose transferase-like glycosyltransferase